jgi:hypothetical protein
LNLTKSLKALREASAGAAESASILLAGEEALVQRAREQFSQGGAVPPSGHAGPLSGPGGVAQSPDEVLVVLTTSDKEAEVRASLGAAARGPVILAVDGGPGTRNKASYLPGGIVRLAFSDSEAGWDRLFSLCAEAAGDKGIALGRRYPAVRRGTLTRLIARTSAQNVFIALLFVPGSDMPAMTLNQARMVLNIAAMYGERLDVERAVELAGLLLRPGFRVWAGPWSARSRGSRCP